MEYCIPNPKKGLKQYIVRNGVGVSFTVFALNEEEAKEEYWKALESILGHQEGCCSCFDNPKSFPREKFEPPASVQEV